MHYEFVIYCVSACVCAGKHVTCLYMDMEAEEPENKIGCHFSGIISGLLSLDRLFHSPGLS